MRIKTASICPISINYSQILTRNLPQLIFRIIAGSEQVINFKQRVLTGKPNGLPVIIPVYCYGTITASMTCITPFDVSISACITFAPAIVTPSVASI